MGPHSLATLAKACHKFTSASKLGFPTKYKSTKARSSGGCASGVCGKGAPAWESRTGTPVALDHGTIASSFAQVRSSRVRFIATQERGISILGHCSEFEIVVTYKRL